MMQKKVRGSKLRDALREEKGSELKSDEVKLKKISKISKKSDKVLDEEAVAEENMSIVAMVVIVLLCFVIGILLGYFLYRLAINSSAVIMIGNLIL